MNPPGLLAELSSVLSFSKYVLGGLGTSEIQKIPITHTNTQTPSILSTISFMYVSCAPCHHLLLTFRALEAWFLHQMYLRILEVDLYTPPCNMSNSKKHIQYLVVGRLSTHMLLFWRLCPLLHHLLLVQEMKTQEFCLAFVGVSPLESCLPFRYPIPNQTTKGDQVKKHTEFIKHTVFERKQLQLFFQQKISVSSPIFHFKKHMDVS